MCSIAKRSSISGVSTRSSSFTFCLVPSDSMRSVSSRISAAIRVIIVVLCLQITTLTWVAELQRLAWLHNQLGIFDGRHYSLSSTFPVAPHD